MAKCDDVKFRVQMKRRGRIYTGVGESLVDALAELIHVGMKKRAPEDVTVLITNLRAIAKESERIEKIVGPVVDMLAKMKGE